MESGSTPRWVTKTSRANIVLKPASNLVLEESHWLAVLMAIVILTLARSQAGAEWYIALDGGMSTREDIHFHREAGPVETTYSRLATNFGSVLGVKLGNYFLSGGWFDRKWIGLEAEAFHLSPTVDSQNLPGVQIDRGTDPPTTTNIVTPLQPTRLRITVATLNAVVRYPGRLVQPYLGAGVGGAILRGDDFGLGKLSHTDLVANLMVGVQLVVRDELALLLEFKNIRTNLKLESGFESRLSEHLFLFGLAWHFL